MDILLLVNHNSWLRAMAVSLSYADILSCRVSPKVGKYHRIVTSSLKQET